MIYCDEVSMGDDYLYPYRTEGFSNGQNFGYLIDWDSQGGGYFTSQEEIDGYYPYSMSYSPRPGDFVYKDMNGDGEIDSEDQVPIGSPSTPELDYSLRLGLAYKGFDFSAQFYGIGNSSIYYSSYGVCENAGIYQQHHLSAWTAERYENGDEITYPALSTSGSTSLISNDFFIQNRRFLRLKNVELGYTLSDNASKAIGVSKVRIYINANNLYTWDSLPFDVIDPEQKEQKSVLPLTRIINFGLNVNF
ncbi:MAG: hypothetical protein SNI51_06190 [Rikenellaceae bacterium]